MPGQPTARVQAEQLLEAAPGQSVEGALTDGEKVELGCKRWIQLNEEHGPRVHDMVLEHMREWLFNSGFEPVQLVCAHVAGNVSQEDWDRVVSRAVERLKEAR